MVALVALAVWVIVTFAINPSNKMRKHSIYQNYWKKF